jgi:hypothetical protein
MSKIEHTREWQKWAKGARQWSRDQWNDYVRLNGIKNAIEQASECGCISIAQEMMDFTTAQKGRDQEKKKGKKG